MRFRTPCQNTSNAIVGVFFLNSTGIRITATVIVSSLIGMWIPILKSRKLFNCQHHLEFPGSLWNLFETYLDVWVVPVVSNDWSMRSACAPDVFPPTGKLTSLGYETGATPSTFSSLIKSTKWTSWCFHCFVVLFSNCPNLVIIPFLQPVLKPSAFPIFYTFRDLNMLDVVNTFYHEINVHLCLNKIPGMCELLFWMCD